MKDCDGNELAVGDVVEVVKPGERHHRGRFSVCQVRQKKVRVANDDTGFCKPPSELRLVRRKEMR